MSSVGAANELPNGVQALVWLGYHPIRPEFTGGANYAVIGDAATAAEAEGISQSHIVAVYQSIRSGWGVFLYLVWAQTSQKSFAFYLILKASHSRANR